MNEYQEMAIMVRRNPEATFAAKEIAHDLLINSGLTEEDIERCSSCPETEIKAQVMVLLA